MQSAACYYIRKHNGAGERVRKGCINHFNVITGPMMENGNLDTSGNLSGVAFSIAERLICRRLIRAGSALLEFILYVYMVY